MTLPMRTFRGKSVLAFIRGGDYAHPGNEVPIEIMMKDVAPNRERLILDVGCGLGGTADFIRRHNWGRVVGFDIDKEAIAYASKTYPDVEFHVADVTKVDQVIVQKFDLICIFGALLCFPNQLEALQALHKVAKINAQLFMFDLIDYSNGTSSLIEPDSKERPVHALSISAMRNMLHKAHWELLQYEDLSANCVKWYAELLTKIKTKKQEIITNFGEYEYDSALVRYTKWHAEIATGRIGHGIYRGRCLKERVTVE